MAVNRLKNIVYPEVPDAHMICVKQKTDDEFGQGYKFENRNIFFRVIRAALSFFAMTLGGLLVKLLVGTRVKGRHNIRKNKKLLKDGGISVCNHIHMWDSIVIMRALRYRMLTYPVWDQNMRGPNRFLIKYTGGVPVPKNLCGLRAMHRFLNSQLQRGKWLHFFAEGSMWFYYKPIRPFKKGAFMYAVHNNKPVLPMAFSYKRPSRLRRFFGRKDPTLVLNIGEPLFPPSSDLPDAERISEFANTVRDAMIKLSGGPHEGQPAWDDWDKE